MLLDGPSGDWTFGVLGLEVPCPARGYAAPRSAMSQPQFSLRLARPSELPEFIRIDDDACSLFEKAGIVFGLEADHPFVRGEVAAWASSIDAGQAYVALDAEGNLLGFMTMGSVDGAAYLDQLSVRAAAMRRGIGATFIQLAIACSAGGPLWLTTYAHVPWNAPYYRRFGFSVAPEAECGPDVKRILETQRAALPHAEHRVAMVRPG